MGWYRIVTSVAILALCSDTVGRRIPSFAGPYRALIAYMMNASEDYQSDGTFWIQLRTTQARGKQPQYGWGSSYMPIPITDEMKIEARMASRSNNQWKKNAFVLKFDRACSNSITHARSLLDLFYGSEGDYHCPLKPYGLRVIQNHSFELIFPHFPVMPYGRYLFTLAVLKGSQTLGVGVAECDAVPRL